ncbi:MAG: hypothetical protein DRI32_05735 [Chloroflexi bacterium]|nr:MAG: hypothetical protein DRI32_05735 [Chloroflexota bacterium]
MKSKGISPVVATVLLIAITVIAVGTIAAFWSTISTPGTQVIANLTLSGVEAGSTMITLTHMGGDPITDAFTPTNDYETLPEDWKNLKIMINGVPVETDYFGGGSIIGIKDETVDDEEFDSDYCGVSSIVYVYGDMYAIAYTGPDSPDPGSDKDGIVKTVRIQGDGTITLTGKSLTFDGACRSPDIIHVSGKIYAIAYGGPYAKVCTVEIDPETGDITFKKSLDLHSGYDRYFKIIHVSGDVYAVVYWDEDGPGILVTLKIPEKGEIKKQSELQFDTYGHDPDIIHISGDIYAIAYGGQSNPDLNAEGMVKTVKIESDGATTSVDSFEFDADHGRHPSIVHISGDVYAIAYTGPDDDGWLKTVEITDGGDIVSVTDSLEFDTSFGRNPEISHISGDIYAISYTGPDEHGWLKTCIIGSSGTVYNGSLVSSGTTYEFGTGNVIQLNNIKVGGTFKTLESGDEITVVYVPTGQLLTKVTV